MTEYRVREEMDFPALGRLREAAWGGQDDSSGWPNILAHSLTWVTAHDRERLVGFVNVAWDGGVHAFLLDTTVHPEVQRQGVGSGLIREAAVATRAEGAHWLHVDFEPHLTEFYAACGFRPTAAGLLRLS